MKAFRDNFGELLLIWEINPATALIPTETRHYKARKHYTKNRNSKRNNSFAASQLRSFTTTQSTEHILVIFTLKVVASLRFLCAARNLSNTAKAAASSVAVVFSAISSAVNWGKSEQTREKCWCFLSWKVVCFKFKHAPTQGISHSSVALLWRLDLVSEAHFGLFLKVVEV